MENVSLDNVRELVPRSYKGVITEEFINTLNECIKDPLIGEEFKENLISYNSVLLEGKYKLSSYVDAVRFVSYAMLGKSKKEAYCLTFPDRYERHKREKVKDISPYVTAYSKNKLVVAIMQQTLVPSYILNQNVHQEAINKLVSVIRDDNTKPMTTVKACEVLLNYTKQPEKTEVSLDVNVSNNVIEDMQVAIKDLARSQLKALENGTHVKDILEARIINEVKNE